MKKLAVLALALELCACHSRAEIRHKFYADCFAAKFTKAQCKFYWRMNVNAMDAKDAADTAVALSAIQLGRSIGGNK